MSLALTTLVVGLTLVHPNPAAAQGSSILLRCEKPPEAVQVQTYTGPVEATVSPIRPSAPTTAVLLVDTLNSTTLADAKKSLIAIFPALHGVPLRVVLFQHGEWRSVGPFATRASLQKALAGIEEPEINVAISAPVLLDGLVANASQFGSRWSRAIVIGDLPSIDPAISDFASAVLVRAFNTQQVRVSWLSPSGNDALQNTLQNMVRSAGGAVLKGSPEEMIEQLGGGNQPFFRLDWSPVPPPIGFVAFAAAISDEQGTNVPVPDLVSADGVPLPTIERYAAMQNDVGEAARLLGQQPLTNDAAQKIRTAIALAFQLNPLDPAALRVAIGLYVQAQDYPTAIKYGKSLVEVVRSDGTAYAALGHALLLGANLDEAETALKHAYDLHAPVLPVVEDLARLQLRRKDDKAALPYLDQALQADAKRQDLWFLQAQTAGRLPDTPLSIRSYEQGLALGGVHITETVSLIRLYLAAKQSDKALQLAKKNIDAPSPNAEDRIELASALDEMQQKDVALIAWRKVVEVQPQSERAHCRIARLLLEAGDAAGAQAAAEKGIEISPQFASLYVVKAEALKKRNLLYGSRRTLEEGAAAATPDNPELLQSLAATEDTYASGAPEAYTQLVQALPASSPQRLDTLERGFTVSLRDADLKHAGAFAELLKQSGHSEFLSFMAADKRSDTSTLVAGGLEALAFAAHANQGIPPEIFFVEYSRVVADTSCSGSGCQGTFSQDLQEYFQRVAALEALGKRDGNRVVITLSVNGKDARHNTEKVLDVLGVKLRSSKGQLDVEQGEKKGQIKKQNTLSALAIDELGIQEALRAGKPYEIEIRDEPAQVYPDEKLWRDAFYSSEKAPGGFAGVLLRTPKLARLYVGVSSIDRKAIFALLSRTSLQNLYEHYVDLIELYGAAFVLRGSHAGVPGGPNAEALWTELVGVSPQDPGAFFHALLEKDNGNLLAFFFAVSQLDRQHQTFLTANASRARSFYKFFASSDELRHHTSKLVADTSFAALLRSVPLDDSGHVDFPGSAEVWTVAKGRSSSDTQTAKMLRKVSKAVAPDLEDEVLLRLAQTRYHEKMAKFSELDNFLAVSRIDTHRPHPLDEESVLLLAQRFADSSEAYAYFTDLTEIDAAGFHQFFAAIDRIKTHPPLEQNLQLGQLHSLIEWICLLKRQHVINGADAAKLFASVSGAFAAAEVEAAYTSAAVDSGRAILAFCGKTQGVADFDRRIMSCLLGSAANADSEPGKSFRRVLEMQKVPSLNTVFDLYDAATTLSAKGAGAKEIGMVTKSAADLPAVEVPKSAKLVGREKDAIVRYDPAPIVKLASELAQKAEKKKPNPKDISKLAQEIVAAMQSQITAALAGPIYAFFLRPTDLIVSGDPLLLRKHHYFDFSSTSDHDKLIVASEFRPTSEGAGSFFVGGYSQFASAAGTAAGASWRADSSVPGEVIAAQIAAIRGANWSVLEELDQRLLGLRILAAREWIVESATRPDVMLALSEETMGLLSASRRADLLNGIESRNWRIVWASVTLPDLLELGGRYIPRFAKDPWSSPVIAELRVLALGNDGSRLNVLGAVPYRSFGCAHPHLQSDAPYEEYEHMLPIDVAERSAEFKIFLAYQADAAGVDPHLLAGVAEPLAAKALRSAQMTNFRDWRSLLAAYASVSTGDVRKAVEQ